MIDHDSDRQFGGDKMFQHLDRVSAWQAGKLPYPVTVELNVTNICNHSCPGCNYSYLVNIDKSSLDFDVAMRIIGELSLCGVKAITFSGGGEPLVYGESRVLELAKYAQSGGLDVALITNGSRLTSPEWWDVATWLRVSLDGYDAATFARFHGKSEREYEHVLDRVRAFGECRPAVTQCTFGVGFLTDAESVPRGDFLHMSALCSTIRGLDYLQFRPLVANMVVDPSHTGGYATFDADDLRMLVDEYQSARARYARDNFRILLSGGKYDALAKVNFGRTYHRCHGHFLEAAIGADAKVYLCCHTQGQERFALGDLTASSFAEIWHSDRSRQVYETTDPTVDCQPACRLHLQNATLERMRQPMTHVNFI